MMTPEALLSQMTRLPPTPQILPRLLVLLSNDNSEGEDIAQLASLDPSLAAQLLRMSNSAYYGRAAKTSNLDEAVQQLGIKEVYKLIAVICSHDLLAGAYGLYELNKGQLWQYALATALAMELIATRLGKSQTSAYTTGLLHCLGKIVINQNCAQDYKAVFDLIDQTQCTLIAAEKKIMGFTNPQVAAALLRKWKFTDDIITPIEYQDTPSLPLKYKEEACMLHVSVFIALHTGMHSGKQAWAMQMDPKSAKACNLEPIDIEMLMLETSEQLNQLKRLMNFEWL